MSDLLQHGLDVAVGGCPIALAESRGRGWSLVSSTRETTAVRRSIVRRHHVSCNSLGEKVEWSTDEIVRRVKSSATHEFVADDGSRLMVVASGDGILSARLETVTVGSPSLGAWQ